MPQRSSRTMSTWQDRGDPSDSVAQIGIEQPLVWKFGQLGTITSSLEILLRGGQASWHPTRFTLNNDLRRRFGVPDGALHHA